jgi:hypothetical protein
VTALARFLLRRLLGIAVLAWATTAATFALVIGVALVSLVADVCYALLDPRIRIT